jgi:hypothetical protein
VIEIENVHCCVLQSSCLEGMTRGFSKARLEGRALEHGLAKHKHSFIRMKGRDGSWRKVEGPEVKEIRKFMDLRTTAVLHELSMQGVHFRGADRPVRLSDGSEKSVDFYGVYGSQQQGLLLEVKWTRENFSRAMTFGRQSLGWLRQAVKTGSWQLGRKPVNARVIGVLVVGPTTWECEVTTIGNGARSVLKSGGTNVAAMKKGMKRYRSGCSQRVGNADKKQKERDWRKTEKVKTLTRTLSARYRETEDGESNVMKHIVARKRP